jgi:glycosyltransferase involved in cell wall biosynthesis
MQKIKVLHAHNHYLQPGGEDTAFSAEVGLLRGYGQEVIEYAEYNERIRDMAPASVALQTVWSWESQKKLAAVLSQERPDIAHFHNTFPLISPSAYYACRAAGIPVVQSLDNPRLICPAATFYRAGRLCEDCLGKTPPFPGVVHGCYHNSRLQTAVVASMLTFHRWIKTWEDQVGLYLVATEFYRRKFIQGGLPAEKIVVKPHFIFPDPGMRPTNQNGQYALFVGRLDPEKGVRTMLEAWRQLPGIRLKIRGDGNLEEETRMFIKEHGLDNIEIVGRLSKTELTDLIKGAKFLIWPSGGYYETFGYVAVESFSCGVPVIASGLGVMQEIVTDNVTGLQFQPGNPTHLADKVNWAWEHPNEVAEMGMNARREYEKKYSAKKNYEILTRTYRRAIELNQGDLD